MHAANNYSRTGVTQDSIDISEDLSTHPKRQQLDDGSRAISSEQMVLLAERQALVLSVIAELLGARDLEHARDAFVGVLQERFNVDRVTLCLADDTGELKLGAISQQAVIDVDSNESRLLLDVCRECLEYERIVCYPNETQLGVLASHRELSARSPQATVASAPLYDDSIPVGALVFEQRNTVDFDPREIELIGQISLLASPCLALHMKVECSVWARARIRLDNLLEKRFGKGCDGAKLLLALIALFVAGAMLVPVPHHITATAEIVPLERRLVTAPFDGFVEEVTVGAGEHVDAGQVLARLERHELEVEGSRRDGEIARAEADFRAAMADHDRQATAVARARLEQERASRALVDQRLGKIEIRAPMSGLIISGDPSGAVGAPTTRGDVLFEIALADDYEVHLLVHERDIRQISEGQVGDLRLRSRPADKLTLQINAVHPVAESADGASRFRVRATIDVPKGVVPMPGESGVAHLDAGRTNLIQRLTRPIAQHVAELWWRLSI